MKPLIVLAIIVMLNACAQDSKEKVTGQKLYRLQPDVIVSTSIRF